MFILNRAVASLPTKQMLLPKFVFLCSPQENGVGSVPVFFSSRTHAQLTCTEAQVGQRE